MVSGSSDTLQCNLMLLSFRLAFAQYLVSILLFIFVIGTGAWFMFSTGLCMIFASFAYAIIVINDPRILFPFADNHGDMVSLKPDFGWAWYLSLVTGIVTVFLSIVILFMNFFFPRKIAAVFHHSVVEEDEFFQVGKDLCPLIKSCYFPYSHHNCTA